jgi:hypothetical protein
LGWAGHIAGMAANNWACVESHFGGFRIRFGDNIKRDGGEEEIIL